MEGWDLERSRRAVHSRWRNGQEERFRGGFMGREVGNKNKSYHFVRQIYRYFT